MTFQISIVIRKKDFVFWDIRHNSNKNELTLWEKMPLSTSLRRDLPHLGCTLNMEKIGFSGTSGNFDNTTTYSIGQYL